ncbi:sensor histidine kinase KdpD [Acetobacteraceae bacterium KSS8]|uniref:histidine kinase n=1 Tax=Endosaccharibacter trunci TaxID=2812733 RepID=A0ABT1W646_9PROT|nr:sensor histidine kinase KdpD [Acetobacteraceae bacterium KSS8]
MDPSRPDPDRLLATAMREHEGRLKIFLGAAPGVGKTWAMLARARALLDAGTDVLAGVIETHGRAGTEEQTIGLPSLPPLMLEDRGRTLAEFDLFGALKRRPALLLMDELAHHNAPGAHHAKRWEDVRALLAAGIDVWTTLNIQHVESLNDDVARITGVRVQETVPDHILDEAAEIELIDLSPQALRDRLREGRIYRPDVATRALENYFREGNLAALREIALRRTANRVDRDVRDWMQAQRVAGPWPAAEHVLALIGPDEAGEAVVRYAKRLADALHAEWSVLHVERPHQPPMRRRSLALARELGATVETRGGRDLVAVAREAASQRNATQLVVGRATAMQGWRRWRALLRGRRNLAASLIRTLPDLPLHAVPTAAPRPRPRIAGTRLRKGQPLFWVTVLVALVTEAGLLTEPLLREDTVGMLFLVAVVVAALLGGLGLSLFAATLAFLSWDFFFIPPVHSITIGNTHDAVGLLVFAAVAGVTGTLGGRVRAEAHAAQARIDSLRRVGAFGRALAGPVDEAGLAHEIASQAAQIAGEAVVLLTAADTPDLLPAAAVPPGAALDERSQAAARFCATNKVETGRGTATLPSAAWRFRLLEPGHGAAMVLGVRSADPAATGADTPEHQALDVLADQATLALDRMRLFVLAAQASAMEDTQKLRTALLGSLGHDLRTPLTGIRGAAETLRGAWDHLDTETRNDLLSAIDEDVVRMTRFLANITELTRLESGQIRPRTEAVSLPAVVEAAIARVPGAAQATVSVSGEADGRRALADPALLEQVLVNVLDNAAKYSPQWSHIAVRITAPLPGELLVEIADEGVGVPPAELPHLFDSFFRSTRGDRVAPGTGLGLAIARGLVEAMGGRITAQSPRPDVPRDAAPGTLVSISLPAGE